jgi:hypothetical protein
LVGGSVERRSGRMKEESAGEDLRGTRYITEREVSVLAGLSTKTLQNWRLRRQGIPFVKLGSAVRYSVADVLKFIEGHKVEISR